MNRLIIGARKEPILQHIPNDNFLLIDDGPIADGITASHLTVREFDVQKDCFSPVTDIDYQARRAFTNVLDAAFQRGDGTLTKDAGLSLIRRALHTGTKSLDNLIPSPDRKSAPGHIWAYDKIQELLESPVLESVLNHGTNFSFNGTIVARLDRAELGDFDCYILGNLMIEQFQGTVVIPDFGFYQCPSHTKLFRQNRLIAGLNALDEAPRFRHLLLAIERKEASRCTPEDAEILARYQGLRREWKKYNDFIEESIA